MGERIQKQRAFEEAKTRVDRATAEAQAQITVALDLADEFAEMFPEIKPESRQEMAELEPLRRK